MLYVADLYHDSLLKVGITRERRQSARQGELRRHFGEHRLELFIEQTIPHGWGEDRQWEQSLLARLRSRRLQLFAGQHHSTEVVEATRGEAWTELLAMLRITEINSKLSASQIDPRREDWRFEGFMSFFYPESREPPCTYWNDVIIRQTFLYWLRGEPIARWEREVRGFSCSEVDNLA